MESHRIITENSLAYVGRDAFSVSPLYSLVIPRRHVADFFEPGGNHPILALLRQTQGDILRRDSSVSAFNMGVNNGRDARQPLGLDYHPARLKEEV
jgi:diadenosine tetraphosphate (Ap4A) HIT family hydrolase